MSNVIEFPHLYLCADVFTEAIVWSILAAFPCFKHEICLFKGCLMYLLCRNMCCLAGQM